MAVSVGNLTISGTGALISQQLLAADNARRFTSISNVVATPVCLSVGTGAVFGMGIVLPTIGSTSTFDRDSRQNTFVNVIGTANIINVAYQTW